MKYIISYTARIVVFGVLLLAGTLAFGQTKEEKKKAKKEKARQEYLQMKQLVDGGKMKIVIDRATGQKGRGRELSGDGYELTINSGQGQTDLPFYGTSQNPGFGSESGIVFKGEMQDYSVEYKEKKNKIILSFKAKSSNSEQLRFIITLVGGEASISVNSSNRSHMSYDGDLRPL